MSEHTIALSRRAFIGTAAVAGAACLVSADPLPAFAARSDQKKAEAQAALDSLNSMQDKLEVATNEYYNALDAQEEAEGRVDEAQNRIEEANGQISDLQEQLGVRARSMYRSGSSTFIDLLLGATTFQAFTTNWSMLNTMNENDAEMVQQTKDLKAEVEEQKVVLEEQQAAAEDAAQQAATKKNEAESVVAQQQAVYDSLSAEVEQLLAEEEAAREAAQAAAAQAAIAAGTTGGTGGGSSSGGGSKPNYNNKVPTAGYDAVSRAQGCLGIPYEYGAAGPSSFDCSGLVSYCLTGSFGRQWSTADYIGWTRVSDPQPGDVCVVHNNSRQHCGIYVGGGQMIHAPRTGDVVRYGGVTSDMVYVRY